MEKLKFFIEIQDNRQKLLFLKFQKNFFKKKKKNNMIPEKKNHLNT